MISLYLCERGYAVTGFAREKHDLPGMPETIVGDARNLRILKEIVMCGGYDVIVNCIGLLNENAENSHEAAVFLNAYLPQFLASVTADTGIQIIHMSTDCVFSGRRGRYTEEDLPDGIKFYDRSKALGEINDGKNVTFRNSIVGPDTKPSGIGLMNWFMQQNGKVSGYRNAVWTGQTTLQLAKTVEQAAVRHAYGLFHMVPDEIISKHDLLVMFNNYLRRERVEITAEDNFRTDKSLLRTNYESFEYKIPGYRVQVEELGIWLREHKELYPHYDL